MATTRSAMTASGEYAAGQMDLILADECSKYYADPYGWVLWAFDWDHGELEGFEGPDTWQKETLIDIGQQVLERGFDGVVPVDPIREATASGHGIGKQISVSQPAMRVIVNPLNKGEAATIEHIKWGDLKPGDYVFGKDGTPTRIIATKCWDRPSYRVTFDDGSFIDVGAEHEWNVKGRQERRNNIDAWRTLETQELFILGAKRPNGKSLARQWEIPTCDPVQFKYHDVYDAYIIGVWLGDGDSTSGSITSARDELWSKMGVTPNRDTLRYKKDCVMSASPPSLYNALIDMNMITVSGDTKFIADCYKYNSEYVRRELVSGMLDSDGEVHSSGSIGYSSTSKQ